MCHRGVGGRLLSLAKSWHLVDGLDGQGPAPAAPGGPHADPPTPVPGRTRRVRSASRFLLGRSQMPIPDVIVSFFSCFFFALNKEDLQKKNNPLNFR